MLLCGIPYYHEPGQHVASKSIEGQDLPALGQKRGGTLVQEATGNLGEQLVPPPQQEDALSLSSPAVSIPVSYSICLPVLRLLSCCSLSRSLPDPTLSYPFPLPPCSVSLKGSQRRSPPPSMFQARGLPGDPVNN